MTQYKAYFAIEKEFNELGKKVNREMAIQSFTNHQKRSLVELTSFEYKEFLKYLNNYLSSYRSKKQNTNEACNQMRRKIIAIFHKMGYKDDQNKADMKRIYSWVKKYGHAKKPMNTYTYHELTTLVTQAEQLLNSHINSI